MLVHVFENFRPAFERLICSGTDALATFWASQTAHPGLAQHPLRGRRDFRHRAIPLSLHGDGVPITGVSRSWGRSLMALSFSSLMGLGTTLQTQFLMFSVFAHLLSDRGKRAMWKVLCWSFDIVWEGVWPSCDAMENRYDPTSPEGLRAGTKLFGGSDYFCVLWCCKADLDFYMKETLNN
jgi:hypothetical protein